MLSLKQIERIKIKMIKENLSQIELAKIMNCSNACVSQIFNQIKDFPKVEQNILKWYGEK